MKRCLLMRPGLVEYGKAWDIQREIFFARSNNEIEDTLILLQHPPTYTFGRSSEIEQPILIEPNHTEDVNNASIYFVDRGGGAAYHGPGQIVGYPILCLKNYTSDYHAYLRMLEDVIIKTLKDFQIDSHKLKDLTGVWVDNKKIGCIGVRIIKGFTMHGFSLNVTNDLSPYEKIIPCNIEDIKMTTIKEIIGPGKIGKEQDLSTVEERIISNFSEVFDVLFET